MSHSVPEPSLTTTGIVFSITIDCVDRKCLISKDALNKLCELKNIDNTDADVMEIFHAFEATINGAARRLVTVETPGKPLVLGPNTFR